VVRTKIVEDISMRRKVKWETRCGLWWTSDFGSVFYKAAGYFAHPANQFSKFGPYGSVAIAKRVCVQQYEYGSSL
jgi:hypothetical protein